MDNNKRRYLWLFAENLGKTANNNSFYFWRHVVNSSAPVDAYFIMEKNANTKAVYATLTKHEKKFVIRRNGVRHAWLYAQADISFVTLSFNDTLPTQVYFKSYKPKPSHHVVHLGHGIIGLKEVYYNENYAYGCLLRFAHYSAPEAADLLCAPGRLRRYQVFEGCYPPRWQELVRRQKALPPHKGRKVLWFPTWREYMGDNEATREFLRNIRKTLANDKVERFLRGEGNEITLCLHPLMFQMLDGKTLEEIKGRFAALGKVRIVQPAGTDILGEIVHADVLVTDYSSLGFDFTFLGKPVVLYAPDVTEYMKLRGLYFPERFAQVAIKSRRKLIEAITGEVGINPYFAGLLRPDPDRYGVAAGIYQQRMLDYFLDLQRNSVAFLGYDFSGVGGTVFATRALAEGLAEKGLMVRLYSFKRRVQGNYLPGVAFKPCLNEFKMRLLDRLKRKILRLPKWRYYLKYDSSSPYIATASGFFMKRLLDTIRCRTVVSTRESLHLFLDAAASPFIKEKVCFFHTSAKAVKGLFPGCLAELERRGVERAVFVTESNREALAKECGLANYKLYSVIGNAVESRRMVKRENIRCVPRRVKYALAILTRLSKDRVELVNRMIQFAQYLKERGNTHIKLHVYGGGDYLKTAKKRTGAIRPWVAFHGPQTDVRKVYRQCDAVVDFSSVQSFGMTYIEGVFNGKMVFCRHNEGSDEVMRNIPGAFYETDSELERLAMNLPNIPLERLQANYDELAARYSREAAANAFLELVSKPI